MMIKKILVVLATLLFALSAVAAVTATTAAVTATTPSGHTVEYVIYNNGTASVRKCSGVDYEGSLVIPSTIEDLGTVYTVTSVYLSGFAGCTGLTAVTLGDSITSLSSLAFANCTDLQEVDMPGVTSIEHNAFSGCSSLSEINLPKCLTTGSWAFCDCTSLTTLTLPLAVSIGGLAFDGCSSLVEVSLPACTSIEGQLGNSLFEGCIKLERVSLPKLEHVPYYLFAGCTALVEVYLPECTSVATSAFRQCGSLKAIHLPLCTTLAEGAFQDCSALDTVDAPLCTSVAKYVFQNCTSLVDLNIAACTSVGAYAFKNCTSLPSVDLPLCTSIGTYAFEKCTSLSTVSLPLCTTVGASAFYQCTSLASVSAPLCTTVGASAFYGCSNLATALFPSLATVESYLFYNCKKLTELEFDFSHTTSIGSYAFSGCSSLAEVDLSQCTTIANNAFYYCSSLAEVDLTSCSSIGSSAFYRCSSLTEVDLSHCSTIGSSAFSYCSQLQQVVLPPFFAVPAYLFNSCSSLVDIDLSQCTSIGKESFYGCSSLVDIDLGNCSTIGERAFNYCSSLDMAELYGVDSIGPYAFAQSGVTYVDLTDCQSLGDYAFSNCLNLAEVDLSGLTAISNSAFAGCSSLATYSIPSTVTTIGKLAFSGCSRFAVIVPDGVESIGTNAFKGTTILFYHGDATGAPWGAKFLNGALSDSLYYTINPSGKTLTLHAVGNANPTQDDACHLDILEYIDVDSANLNYASVDGVLYNKDLTSLVRVPEAYGRNLTIPASVVTIQNRAMEHTSMDTLFLLARSCTSASVQGYSSYAINPQVDVLEVGEDVETIHFFFRNLHGLKAINVHPDNPVFRSWDGILVDSASTTLLRYPAGRPDTAFVLPSAVTTIGPRAFYHVDSLRTLDLADVRSVGDSAFEFSSSLASVAMDSVSRIGRCAFRYCTSLRTATLPTSLDTIGIYAFAGDTLDTLFYDAMQAVVKGKYSDGHTQMFRNVNLRHVVFGDQVRALPDEVFYGCSHLDRLQLPPSLQSIGAHAFEGCTSLSELDIPPAVTSIGSQPFAGCSLRKVYYNAVSTVEFVAEYYKQTKYALSMGADLFSGAHVDRLVVGEGVKKMTLVWNTGVDTLELPMSLDTIFSTIGTNAPVSDLIYVAFNCKNLVFRQLDPNYPIMYYHPCSVLPAYSESALGLFPKSEKLQQVVFGDSVHSIPAFCFRNCSTLQQFVDLELPSSVTSIGGGAFEGCTQIERATIHEGVTHIGAAPFLRCGNLTSLTFNALAAADLPEPGLPALTRIQTNNDQTNLDSSDSRARRFQPLAWIDNLPPIDTVHFGPGVTEVPACLVGYSWLYTVDSSGKGRSVYLDIDTSVHLRRIGGGAFANLHLQGDADALLGDSIRAIGDGAFMNVSGISKAMLPIGFTSLGHRAFYRCGELDSVSLPSTLTAIGGHAFADDSLLSYLHYDCDSAEIIDDELDGFAYPATPFNHTVSLRTIDFGPHVRYLTEGMFKNAEGLQRLTLPNGVEVVEAECFYTDVTDGTPRDREVSGSSLRYVELPASCRWIGGSAFSNNGHHPLDTLVCLSPNPPTLANSHYKWETDANGNDQAVLSLLGAFDSLTCQKSLLLLPCYYMSLYSAYSHDSYSERWSDFANITGMLPYEVVLTVNVDTMGTAEWECATGGVQLTATPAPSHRFLQWSDGNSDNPRTITLESDTAFEAQFAWGVIYTVSVSSSNSSHGSVTGSGSFIQESIDTLTATANYGYHFSQWSDGNTDNPRYLTVLENTTLTASFLPNQYTLEVNCDDEQGTVSGGGSYDYNTSHSISATAAVGYHFTQWSDGVTDNPRSVTLTQDTSFTAEFAINVYTLTVTAGEHGTATGGGDYSHGSEASLTATAEYGYHFTQWSDGNTDNPRYLTVLENTTLTASFLPNQYTLEVNCDDEQGTVSGGGSYDYNTSHSISATAAVGYHFTQWSDGVTDNPRSVTLMQDTSFTAEFAINVYTLTVTAGEHGTATGGGDYSHGSEVTLTATAEYGYHFTQWSDGNSDNPRQYTVTADATLMAQFAPNRYAISATIVCGDAGINAIDLSADSASYNTTVILTASAGEGYYFSNWDDGSTDNPRTVTVVSDTTIGACFNLYTYTVSLSCDEEKGVVNVEGDFDGNGTFRYGDTATLIATAKTGYYFSHWNDGNTDNPRIIVVSSDISMSAFFNSKESIDDVYEDAGIKVSVIDGCIMVEGAENRQVHLYDAIGRHIADRSRHLTQGVYLLQVEGLPVRRVVVF